MNINSINVSKHSLSNIFDIESKTVFSIPKYQREYTWGINEWETLFDDLIENSEGYFLGSIICINASPEFSSPKYEVVDGQQRLLTLSLLLAALYDVLQEHKEQLDEDDQACIVQLKKHLTVKTAPKTLISRLVPQKQGSNLDDYLGLLAKIGVLPPAPMPGFAGIRRVVKAYRYFQARIKERMAQNGMEGGVAEAFFLRNRVCSAIFVVIEVSSHSDAYTLFESLNNRGVPLTAVDLIKNLLLSKLDGDPEADLDYCFERWTEIIENLGDRYAEQERFFRQNYNAFRKSLNAPFAGGERQYPLGAIATRSNLLDIYERIISKDPGNMLKELSANALIYSGIVLNRSSLPLTPLQEAYRDLKRVQGAPAYLLLLYLEKRRKELQLADEDLAGVCRLLVSFFVRRNLTDLPPTRDLSRMFMAFIEEIEEHEYLGGAVLENLRKRLAESSASDEAFAERLRGPVYEDNANLTRFILCMMEEKRMTAETAQDLWRKTGSQQFVWTIEHIFPQGGSIPQAWVDMIADGDRDMAKEIQLKYVHTLGNLTITGYNSALGGKSFEEKKNRRDANGSFIGYRNGLHLNSDVCDKETWTVEAIKERTERLAKVIMDMFRMQP